MGSGVSLMSFFSQVEGLIINQLMIVLDPVFIWDILGTKAYIYIYTIHIYIYTHIHITHNIIYIGYNGTTLETLLLPVFSWAISVVATYIAFLDADLRNIAHPSETI